MGYRSARIPGLGPFIAAGPVMVVLAGRPEVPQRETHRSLLWDGDSRERLTGALMVWGIPEYKAKRYEGKVKSGNILLSIHTENSDERERAKETLVKGGQKISLIQKKSSVRRTKNPPISRFFNLTNHFFIFRCKIRCERAHFEPNVLLRQSTGPTDDHSTLQLQ